MIQLRMKLYTIKQNVHLSTQVTALNLYFLEQSHVLKEQSEETVKQK